MPFFKCVYQYTQVDHGFTEVYYREAATLAAAATFSDVHTFRAINFRNALTALRKIRVSDVLNNRSSVVVNVNRSTNIDTGTPDTAWNSIMWTLVAPSNTSKRQVWFRGLDDISIIRNNDTGADEPNASVVNGIQLWVQNLALNTFCVRALTRLTVPPMAYTNISAVTVTTPGAVSLTVPAGFALTTSGRVIVSQISNRQFPGINRHWRGTLVGSSSLVIPYTSALPAGVYPLQRGRTRPEEYTYGVISSSLSSFNRFASRDTGRNPLGGRGRRSNLLGRSA